MDCILEFLLYSLKAMSLCKLPILPIVCCRRFTIYIANKKRPPGGLYLYYIYRSEVSLVLARLRVAAWPIGAQRIDHATLTSTCNRAASAISSHPSAALGGPYTIIILQIKILFKIIRVRLNG